MTDHEIVEAEYSVLGSVKITDCALQFCDDNKLRMELQESVDLISSSFPTVTDLTAEYECDPDVDSDKWINLIVTLTGDSDSALVAYNRYSAEWVRSVPVEKRYLIRLSFNII